MDGGLVITCVTLVLATALQGPFVLGRGPLCLLGALMLRCRVRALDWLKLDIKVGTAGVLRTTFGFLYCGLVLLLRVGCTCYFVGYFQDDILLVERSGWFASRLRVVFSG